MPLSTAMTHTYWTAPTHTVKLNVNAGTALREAAAKAKVQKVEGTSTDPYITSVVDKVSGDNTAIKVGSEGLRRRAG